jgi:hypothetical protein
MQLLQRRQMVRDMEANVSRFFHYPKFSMQHLLVREEESANASQVL